MDGTGSIMIDVWKEFLDIAREESGSRIVETWFKAIVFDRWDASKKTVYLIAPNSFVYNWVRKHYISMMQLHLGRLLHEETPRIELIVQGTKPKSVGVVQDQVARIVPASIASVGKNLVRAGPKLGLFNQNYLFDNFIVGPSNSLAYAAARAITEQPGMRYNPLFMYGKSGLGKTHLMYAIGNEIKTRYKDALVLYQTADRFVTEFISAIRFNKVPSFQERYNKVDVLLIDDMQFISNKEHTQEAFFHIFNALYESRKQIVFSSDAYPHDIKGIADRLRSRLTSGLVTDLREPSLETKIAILKKKSSMHEEPLSDEVAHFIASQGFSNIRELEGALIRVTAFAALTKQPITLLLAQKVLLRVYRNTETASGSISFKKIVRGVEKFSSYTMQDLCSKSRNKEVAEARHLAMFLMKKLTGKSLRDIGTFLGGRDHSTVMHGLQKIEENIKQDSGLLVKVRKLEREISGM
jgi:chromosomal replication initiator protein